MSVVWFDLIGFRPFVVVHHRADGSDRHHMAPAPDADAAYLSKFDWPGETLTEPLDAGYFTLDQIPVATPTQKLATPGGDGPTHAAPTISLPGGWLPCCFIGHAETPGVIVITEPLPQPAPVPIMASAPLLIAALMMLALMKWRMK